MTGWVRDVFEMVLAGVVMAVVMMWVVAPYRVSGESMLPTYKNGNMLLVNKLVYRFTKPKPGEVVIARTDYGVMVKRVVREVEDNKFWLEGDNKDKSTDSREYGPVERARLIAKVVVKLW